MQFLWIFINIQQFVLFHYVQIQSNYFYKIRFKTFKTKTKYFSQKSSFLQNPWHLNLSQTKQSCLGSVCLRVCVCFVLFGPVCASVSRASQNILPYLKQQIFRQRSMEMRQVVRREPMPNTKPCMPYQRHPVSPNTQAWHKLTEGKKDLDPCLISCHLLSLKMANFSGLDDVCFILKTSPPSV